MSTSLKALVSLLAPALPLLAAGPVGAAAGPWVQNGPSEARLISPYRIAPSAGELRLGVHFRLQPGWHVYWKNSGDAGFAPTLALASTPRSGARFTASELLWPAPRRFELPGGLVAFGYENEVVYPVRTQIQPTGAGPLEVRAALDYVTCREDCIPYRATLTLSQPLGAPAADAATAGLLDAWWARLPLPADSVPGLATTGVLDAGRPGGPVLEIQVRGAGGNPAAVDLFLASHPELETGRPHARQMPGGGLVFEVPVHSRQSRKPLPRTTVFDWTVTGLVLDVPGGAATTAGHAANIAAVRQVALAPLVSEGEARQEPGSRERSRSGAPAAGQGSEGPAASPVWHAAAASLCLLAALCAWGLLPLLARRTGANRWDALREAAGFALLGLLLWPLHALSRELGSEALAGIELALLAAALLAWLRQRLARGAALRFVLALGLLACAALAPLLAAHGRQLTTLTPLPPPPPVVARASNRPPPHRQRAS